MSKQIKGKLIGKISEISEAGFGDSLYFRPYRVDEQMIEEIAEAIGEKKSAVAQKLLHLDLHTSPDEKMRESRQIELLDWLIFNEKNKAAQTMWLKQDSKDWKNIEKNLKSWQKSAENSRFTRIIVSEIYCMVSICMSYLNQIFTKLIEYFSPNEVERNNSSDFANRNIINLLEHSLAELEKLSEHHDLDLKSEQPELLYLFTKI